MALSHKDYRSHLYANRTHPEQPQTIQKSSLSLSFWIMSSIPFLIIEYFFEVEFKRLPSGLVFPAGYVMFWGFYQSLLFSKFNGIPKIKAKKARPLLKSVKMPSQEQRHSQEAKQSSSKSVENFLPEKILQNLSVLGLKPTREWSTIQKRYRELAKQYHPDLNPDITTRGTRFMIYDAAYRNLLKFKKEYFK